MIKKEVKETLNIIPHNLNVTGGASLLYIGLIPDTCNNVDSIRRVVEVFNAKDVELFFIVEIT